MLKGIGIAVLTVFLAIMLSDHHHAFVAIAIACAGVITAVGVTVSSTSRKEMTRHGRNKSIQKED